MYYVDDFVNLKIILFSSLRFKKSSDLLTYLFFLVTLVVDVGKCLCVG